MKEGLWVLQMPCLERFQLIREHLIVRYVRDLNKWRGHSPTTNWAAVGVKRDRERETTNNKVTRTTTSR